MVSDKLSNKDIAVYALYLLGGWQTRIHTEDIALKCFELSPSKFSWVKYPQYPEFLTAIVALETAKKQKNGFLVEGESERTSKAKKVGGKIGGWKLTPNGIRWIKENLNRIEYCLEKKKITGDRLPSDRKLKELLRSEAFNKYKENKEHAKISHAEFAESLVCTVNTGSEVLNDRLDQLYSVAEELEIEDVKDYVEFCRKNFSSLLKN